MKFNYLMAKPKKIYGLLLGTLFFLLVSCVGGESASSGSTYYRDYAEKKSSEATGQEADSEKKKEQRMIIYNATLDMVVKEPDTFNVQLPKIAEKYEGYMQSKGTTSSVMRIKSQYLNQALKEITAMGKVRSQDLRGDDVTNEYLDYQIRLENAEKARARYLELLQKAQSVQDILTVEKELERLNGEIDSLKGRINRISHLSTYSTITVYVQEKKKPGVVGFVFVQLYKGVKWLFVRN